MRKRTFRNALVVFFALWIGVASCAVAAPPDRAKHALNLRGKRVVVVTLTGHTAMASKDNGFFNKRTDERTDPGFTIEPLVQSEIVAQLKSFGVNAESAVVDYDDAQVFTSLRQTLLGPFPGLIRKDYLESLAARLFAEHTPDAVLVVSRGTTAVWGDSPRLLGYGVVANKKRGMPFAAVEANLFVPGDSSPLLTRVAAMAKPSDLVESDHVQNLPTGKMWKALQPKIEECAVRSARMLAISVYARALAGRPLTFDERRRYPRDEFVDTGGGL